MKQKKQQNDLFSQLKRSALFLYFLTFCLTSQAQIGLITGAIGEGMANAKEKKIQKSPAKEVIISSNLAIKKVYDQHSSGNVAKKLIEYDEARFVKSFNAYDSLEYYKNEIKRLDPKWKVKEIETSQTTYAAKHKEFSDFYLKYRESEKKCVEYNIYFSEIYEKARKLEGKGFEFYQFLTGKDENKFDLAEYRKKEMEVIELSKTHEYYDKQLNRWYAPRIDGIEYLGVPKGAYRTRPLLSSEIQYFEDRYKGADYFIELKNSDFPGVLKSLRSYENMYYRVLSLLILFPEDEKVIALHKKIELNYKKFDAYKEEIALSPFHKANMGKTFFSDHKITFGKETAADFKTEFKAGEPIFMIYYGSDPFYLKNETTYNLFVKVGDELKNCDKYDAFSYPDGVTGDGKTLIYQYCLAPTQDLKLPANEYAQANRTLACLAQLTPGEHKISFNNYLGDASITLIIDESNNYKKAYDYAHNVYFNSIPLPKVGMTDASVHGWVVKAFANSDSKDLVGVQHLRTYIVSKEWNYFTNKYTGQINERRAEIVLVCKDNKGDCFIFYADFSQDKAGSVWLSPSVSFRSGSYIGDDYYRGDEKSRVYINCSKF